MATLTAFMVSIATAAVRCTSWNRRVERDADEQEAGEGDEVGGERDLHEVRAVAEGVGDVVGTP